MIVMFCGHTDSMLTDNEQILLKKLLVDIIKNNETCSFYLGAYGNFDTICFKILTELKIEYKIISRVFITPYLYKSEKLKTLSKIYDETIYPPIEKTPPKFAILKRNRWMVENSDLLICYISHTFGGAYTTYKYALSKKIKIINVYQK